MKNITILDCTLRDGGLGLEDAYKNHISDDGFTLTEIDEMINELKSSKLDIIELGSIEISNNDKRRFAIYQNVEDISKKIPRDRTDDQMYVGLFRGPDTPVKDIPEWNPSLVDGLRVIIRYSELHKSMEFCAALAQKGYRVFVQPMLTMRYTDEEIEYILTESNRMEAYAVYFVDSYGYMQAKDVETLAKKYDAMLDPGIAIGFHAHNNLNLAFSNVLSLFHLGLERKLIVDSCATGMGQGAGNLQTELIVPYLTQNCGVEYNYSAILNLCEYVEKHMVPNPWGYSVTRMLPAIYKTAYKYATTFRNQYHMSYSEMNEMFAKMPNEYRHRFTPEFAKEVIQIMQK